MGAINVSSAECCIFFSEAPDWIPSSVPTETLRVQGDCIAVLKLNYISPVTTSGKNGYVQSISLNTHGAYKDQNYNSYNFFVSCIPHPPDSDPTAPCPSTYTNTHSPYIHPCSLAKHKLFQPPLILSNNRDSATDSLSTSLHLFSIFSWSLCDMRALSQCPGAYLTKAGATHTCARALGIQAGLDRGPPVPTTKGSESEPATSTTRHGQPVLCSSRPTPLSP